MSLRIDLCPIDRRGDSSSRIACAWFPRCAHRENRSRRLQTWDSEREPPNPGWPENTCENAAKQVWRVRAILRHRGAGTRQGLLKMKRPQAARGLFRSNYVLVLQAAATRLVSLGM